MFATDTHTFPLTKHLKFFPITDPGPEPMACMENDIDDSEKNQNELSPDKIIEKNETHKSY